MKRVALSRRHHVDLVRRRLETNPVSVVGPGARALQRVDELRALLRLVERGVLSADEFERQEGKVFRRPPDL